MTRRHLLLSPLVTLLPVLHAEKVVARKLARMTRTLEPVPCNQANGTVRVEWVEAWLWTYWIVATDGSTAYLDKRAWEPVKVGKPLTLPRWQWR